MATRALLRRPSHTAAFATAMRPPDNVAHMPAACVTTRYVHTSINKDRCPINVCSWAPDVRYRAAGEDLGGFRGGDG